MIDCAVVPDDETVFRFGQYGIQLVRRRVSDCHVAEVPLLDKRSSLFLLARIKQQRVG